MSDQKSLSAARPENAPRLRLAIAGAGLIGRMHAKLVLRSSQCGLVAIADPQAQAADFAKALGVPHYAGLRDMLDRERLDGVIVATPNASHASNAIDCIDRGVPVLIEKPVADTVADAERIAAAAERAGVAVLVGHHRRHNPIISRAREIVRSGRIGRVATVAAFVTFQKPKPYFDVAWRREPGGGPVLINAIHDIDNLRYVVGEIVDLQAITSSSLRGFAVEDSAVVAMRFADGALGTITLSDAAAAPWSWELTAGENSAYPQCVADCYLIAGTEGSLAVPSLRLWRYGKDQGWNAPLIEEQAAVEPADPYEMQLRHFCAVVRGEEPPLVTARDAGVTLAVTCAIHEAARGAERM
jgi:predicted dehydrogenase